MKILVLAGYCLRVNSSANLCHISYINGLLSDGHTVDLLTVSDKNQNIDASIEIPKVNRLITYATSLYTQMGAIKNKASSGLQNDNGATSRRSCVRRLKTKAKEMIRKCYGVHGTDAAWYWKGRCFKNNEPYDVVISLAYPPVSHRLAEYLIKHKQIKTSKWIQIWEDPWYADIFGYSHTEQIRREEARLLKAAQSVYYVSPLTLLYQKKAFPESVEKMRWQPLPSYYRRELNKIDFSELVFGYFGDYTSHIRNLKPFYEAMSELKTKGNICGNSDQMFATTDTINVFPRMTVGELQQYEDASNVLVFLCNLKGGQIPGKIYQYSATNKIILFILDGTEEEKRVLREYFSSLNRYIFCENNKEDIINTIREIQLDTLPESYYTPLDCFAPRDIIQNILNGR